MPYDPDIHHRHSIRLRGYDYSQPGTYYVTVCTQKKKHIFGEVVEGEMSANDCCRIVARAWQDLPGRFPHITLDEFVVMPNHVHGIIIVGGRQAAPKLGDIIRAFKSSSAIAVNQALARAGQPVWQRNYYEHIVRNQDELSKIREYIRTNPLRWPSDPEYS